MSHATGQKKSKPKKLVFISSKNKILVFFCHKHLGQTYETILFVFCRRYEDFKQSVFEFFSPLIIECSNYSREEETIIYYEVLSAETIQMRKLFVEIQYVQPFTINSYIGVGWMYKNPVLRKNLNGLGFKVSDFDVSCLKAVVQCATSTNNRNFWIHYNDHIDIGIVLLHVL